MENRYVNPEDCKQSNKYLNVQPLLNSSFIEELRLANMESYTRSTSAKIGWMKYRVNYKMGDIREGIRNSLGLKPLSEDNSSFKY